MTILERVALFLRAKPRVLGLLWKDGHWNVIEGDPL